MTESSQQAGDATTPGQEDEQPGTMQTLLQEGLEVVQEETEREVVALVGTGLDRALTDEARTRLEHQADDAAHVLLEEIVAILPDAVRSRAEMDLGEMERALQQMVREALDTLWEGSLRTDLEERLESGARALFHGDLSTAQAQVEQIVHRVGEEMLQVLLAHWSQVHRIVLPLLVATVTNGVSSAVEEGVQAVATTPASLLEEQASPVKRQLADRAAELRERLADAKEEMKENMEHGVHEAVRDGVQHRAQLGRAPLHPPPAGPPRRRPPGT